MSPSKSVTIGQPFQCVEERADAAMLALDAPLVVCANDPPWTSFSQSMSSTARAAITVVDAWNMDLVDLTQRAAVLAESELVGAATIVGFGGGTALDTAKFMAWKLGRPLVQVPTITSVDAGFTDAIGIRDHGKVRYIGNIVPDKVVIDIDLIRSAPKRLNRAGIGDIMSCHTGLFDWKLASDSGHGPTWDPALATLGETMLEELEAAAADIAAVTPDGVRFLADAYRRIGAACAHAGHSRFEEGSEHFWAYAYEHATGAHPVHGEIIAFAVCALAHVQGNDADRARRIVATSHARAHPHDLDISEEHFRECLLGLTAYARAERLDMTIVDFRPITDAHADSAWKFVRTLPRRGDA